MTPMDVIIIGAGAAGLMCAMEAGKRGRRVLVIDHAKKPAEKIRISGGGRCNFTNLHASPKQFLSQNPHFCVSALSRYTQHDFIALVKKHGIAFHEKTLGQLFCDGSATEIIDMLLKECADAGVTILLTTSVQQVGKVGERFEVNTSAGSYDCASLVVACGGLSIPKMGATGLGYDIARQFGVTIVPTSAALVPFTLAQEELSHFSTLSGIAVDATARTKKQSFREGILFTHRGLSGPAVLQISSYWTQGEAVIMDLLPDQDMAAVLKQAKAANPKQELTTVLGHHLPKRVVKVFLDRYGPMEASRKMAEFTDKRLVKLGQMVNQWQIIPSGTEGYRTAEVTLGGVDTNALSSKSMECREVPGLFFIGEVVDVTGHLGGFNFQWAWSSGFAAGQCV
jgi:predicted Rossmann fold flavoprotein